MVSFPARMVAIAEKSSVLLELSMAAAVLVAGMENPSTSHNGT